MFPLVALAHALTLDDAWSAAERDGVETALLEEQYRAARTTRGAAWSLVSPKLVLRGSYTRNNQALSLDPNTLVPEELRGVFDAGDPIVVRPLEYGDASLSVVQPLFSGTALPLLRAAYAEVGAADADRRRQVAQLRAGVAEAFWGAIVARHGVDIADRARALAEKHLELGRRQVELGLAPRTVALQGEIALSRATREVAVAEAARTLAESALGQLTGWPSGAPLEEPTPSSMPFSSVDEAVAMGVDRRPDVELAQRRVESARHQSLARGLSWLPDVNGRFTYAWTENTSAFSDQTEFWMVVAESEWVLWDGGYRLAQQAQASAQSRMASLAASRATELAEVEIRGAYATLARHDAALAAVTRERALAEENARLAEVAFAAGSITFLELESARLGLAAAELAVLQTRAEREVSAVRLQLAVGAL